MTSLFNGGTLLHWIPVTEETKTFIQRVASGQPGVAYSPGTGPLVEIALKHAITAKVPPTDPFRPTERIPVRLMTDYRGDKPRKTGAILDAAIVGYRNRSNPVLEQYGRREQYVVTLPRRLLLGQAEVAFRDGHDILDDLTATIEETMRQIHRDLLYLDGRMIGVDVPISTSLYEKTREVAWKRSQLDIDTLIAQKMDGVIRTRTTPGVRWRMREEGA